MCPMPCRGIQAALQLSLKHVLTVSGDDSQRKRSDSEDLVAEHVDSGNLIGGGDEVKYVRVGLMQLQR